MFSMAQVIALLVIILGGGLFIAAASAIGRRWEAKHDPEPRVEDREPKSWDDSDLKTEWMPRTDSAEESVQFEAGDVKIQWRRKK